MLRAEPKIGFDTSSLKGMLTAIKMLGVWEDATWRQEAGSFY